MKSYGTRYEVYTRPELYEIERPLLSPAVKIGIALATVAVLLMLRASMVLGLLHN